MKSSILHYLTLGVAFTCLLACTSVLGQAVVSAPNSRNVNPPKETFDLDFPGGTPEALLNALESVMSERPNVIVAPQVEDVELPAMNVRSVALHDVFNALNVIFQNRGREAVFHQPRGSTIWILRGPVEDEQQFSAAQERISYQDRVRAIRASQSASQQTSRETRVYFLGVYLETYSIADITTAIETAWGLVPEEETSQFKFHKDTQLLIVRGTQSQLNILENVLSELQSGVKLKQMKDRQALGNRSAPEPSSAADAKNDSPKE